MSGSVIGYVAAAAQIGLGSLLIKPKRGIATLVPQVVIEETHHDDLEITEHPVEQGAVITDHAFKRPSEVTIAAAWSNSPSAASLPDGVVGAFKAIPSAVNQAFNQAAANGNSAASVRDVYDKLLTLQSTRVPFEVFTGKRVYANMLLKTLVVTTNPGKEQSLFVVATFRQLLIVQTQTISVAAPAANQADPGVTQAPTDPGSKSLVPSTKFIDAI